MTPLRCQPPHRNAELPISDQPDPALTARFRSGHELVFAMNALPCTLLAIATLAISAGAQQPATERVKERASDAAQATRDTVKRAADAVAKTTRQAWVKTKAYLSDDPDTYRRGAEQKLSELRAEIAELRKQTAGLKNRKYFLTRVEALERHLKYATNQLAALPPEEIRKGRNGQRKPLDTTLEHLEDHTDLAQREVKSFTAR